MFWKAKQRDHKLQAAFSTGPHALEQAQLWVECGTFAYTGDEQGETDRNTLKRPCSQCPRSEALLTAPEVRTAFRSTVIFSITKYCFKIITVSPARTITSSTNTPKIKESQTQIAQDCGDPWRPGKPMLLSQQDVPAPQYCLF